MIWSDEYVQSSYSVSYTHLPLGYIPLGVITPTTVHIPVIIAGIILGWKKGAFAGFVFGLTSFLKASLDVYKRQELASDSEIYDAIETAQAKAVSYTHLDVYKRQVLSVLIRLLEKE